MSDPLTVLVVGGAGYIGSHCVRQILSHGHVPVVLDNLSLGHHESLPSGVVFVEGDLGDRDLVRDLLVRERVDVVMHFAAFASVGESMAEPLKYYHNNVACTVSLLQAMEEAGVRRFVFSSTCATFGSVEELPIHEGVPQRPINPYGQTKLDVERLLESLCAANGFSCAVFRYFNAAGAAEGGEIGEDHDPELHLIPLCIEAATGRRGALKVFGTDYDTPDGTCLRDYVHVDDISQAHIAVFDKLKDPGGYFHYNLGTGSPTSVLEVIESVERVTGLKVPREEAERRAGDPASLYANSEKAERELGWLPKFREIDKIVESAWEWHRLHPDGFEGK